MSSIHPDLDFPPSPQVTGFTKTGVATFDNLHPTSVIRELLQNSLDAASEANVQAKVRFRLSKAQTADIPGIENYKDVFERAIHHQKEHMNGKLGDKPQSVVDRIQGALKQEEIDILEVFDNGIGLNEKSLTALLSDGLSGKKSEAMGTYGNGHLTVIPASNLRYIMYASVSSAGSRIGSGHAVLASHKHCTDRKFLGSGDGYLVKDFQAGEGLPFEFAKNDELPKVLIESLETLKSHFPHGTVVIIPSFNHFKEDKESIRNLVFKTAGTNFFPAIHEEKLQICVEDARVATSIECESLDRSTLLGILEENQNNIRGERYLSGRNAFEAFKTFAEPTRNDMIDTGCGFIEIYLREDESKGRSRIDLFRLGMWIAHFDRLTRKLTDQIAFQAVLVIHYDDGGKLYNLIRKAEGPLHNELSEKRLSTGEKREYNKALDAIVQWLKDNTAKVQTEAYFSDDHLALDFGEADGKGTKSRKGFRGVPVVTKSRLSHSRGSNWELTPDPVPRPKPPEPNPGPGPEPDPDPPSPPRPKHRPSLTSLFRAVNVPVGNSRQKIQIHCNKDVVNAELRLVVDEAIDATCERPHQDRYMPVALSEVTINDEVVSDGSLRKIDGAYVGIPLGNLKAGNVYSVETNYSPRGELSGIVSPSLRIELLNDAQKEITNSMSQDQ